MFGYPCAFIRGNMFAGVTADGVFIRLPEPERTDYMAKEGGRSFEPMPGRIMKDYALVPAAALESEEALRALLRRSLDHAKKLPERLRLGRARKP